MVSVIIPLYNKAPYIERALRSVLSQTVLPEEVIVVDDGSTDGGGEIVLSFREPFIKLVRQENRGVSGARNKGLALAQGDLIAFLDADDVWKPRFLEVILRLREKFPQAGAYAVAYDIVRPDGSLEKSNLTILPPHQDEGIIENYYRVARYYPLWTSALAVPKQILIEIGGFPLFERRGQDLDSWLRIALFYPVVWRRESLAIYYQNESQWVPWPHEHLFSRRARLALESGLIPNEQVADLKDYLAPFQVNKALESLVWGSKHTARNLLAYSRGARRIGKKWWKVRLVACLPGALPSYLVRFMIWLKNLKVKELDHSTAIQVTRRYNNVVGK